jgi:hypothetical protein
MSANVRADVSGRATQNQHVDVAARQAGLTEARADRAAAGVNGATTIPVVQLVGCLIQVRHALEVEMTKVDATIPKDSSNSGLGISAQTETLVLGHAKCWRGGANREQAGTP